jgi:hypothetical protein
MNQYLKIKSQIAYLLDKIYKLKYWVIILVIINAFVLHPQSLATAQEDPNDPSTVLTKSDNNIFLPVVNRQVNAYYVSPGGNDHNPGTINLPFRTIEKADSVTKPGDYVYLRGGIYTEAVDLHHSGNAGNPIKYLAYPGESPIIDGKFYGNIGILVNIIGDYVNLSGIELKNSSGWGIYVAGNHDVVDNVYVHHTDSAGIMISEGQGSIVQNSRVWRAALDNEYGDMSIGWATGISAARNGVSYAIIRNNHVWETWGEGISTFEADHTIIEDNIVHDSFSANIYISDSTNVICQRNFVYTNPNTYIFNYGYHGGIAMGDEKYTPPSANISVINNISFGNLGNFWWWPGSQGGGMNNVLIANNTFINGIGDINSGRGNVIISRGDHQNVRFENNIIYQNDSLPLIVLDSSQGITFSHNLWSKTPRSIASGPGDIIGDPLFSHNGDQYSPYWYELSTISPAINNALTLSEVVVDFFNKNREAPPDMGANEFFPIP